MDDEPARAIRDASEILGPLDPLREEALGLGLDDRRVGQLGSRVAQVLVRVEDAARWHTQAHLPGELRGLELVHEAGLWATQRHGCGVAPGQDRQVATAR